VLDPAYKKWNAHYRQAIDEPAAMEVGIEEMWSELAGGRGSYHRLVCAWVLVVSLAVLYLKRSRRPKRCLPPGPRGWPLVGNLFQVAFAGKPIIYVVRDLREKFGPIFTLRMGKKTLVIITCPLCKFLRVWLRMAHPATEHGV
jgi:hypothetical protein